MLGASVVSAEAATPFNRDSLGGALYSSLTKYQLTIPQKGEIWPGVKLPMTAAITRIRSRP